MLVCSVSQLARRAAIVADLAEATAALDSPGTGNIVFATLVDDPASVQDRVDAYRGQIMLEAASASETINAGSAYAASVVEAAAATETSASVGPVGDPYWSSVKLLLGFEGADASTGSPGMTDESSTAKGTATVFAQAQIDTAQFKFGASSLLLDGTLDRVRFAGHSDFTLSNQPFTLECWIRPTIVTGGANRFVCACWEGAGTLSWVFYQFNGEMWLNVSTNGTTSIALLGGGAMTANTWHAVCVDFNGSKYRIYINGAMVASSTSLQTISGSNTTLTIGASTTSGTSAFSGWIDEVRLTKAARYASDSGYTVSTTAFPRF